MIALDILTKSPKTLHKSFADDTAKEIPLSFEDFLKNLAKDSDKTKENSDVAQLLKLLQNKEDSVLKFPNNLSEEITDDPKESKTELLNLLKIGTKEEKNAKTIENSPLTLNPAFTQTLSITELKYLIHKAKQYLKRQITTHFPQIKNEELPKNLKGLLQIAQKLKIEVKSISFETVSEAKKLEKHKTASSKTQEDLPDLDTDLQQQKQPKISKTIKTKTATQTEHIGTKEKNGSIVETIETKIKTLKTAALFQEKTQQQTVTTKELITSMQQEKQEHKPVNPLESLLRKQADNIRQEPNTNTPIAEKIAALKQTIATNQPNQNGNDAEEQNKKQEMQTLKELLQKEDVQNKSYAEIKIKTADSFEVKLNEAKQMVKYLSSDIKRAIEDYKPPFSRMKIKLNPQKLGEIDLTIVQRGNNVHINLSSNNAAINLLANNLNDLKTQLQQNGINNASFNFSGHSQNEQNERERQKARQKYEYIAKNEENEELQPTLDIIIPRYI